MNPLPPWRQPVIYNEDRFDDEGPNLSSSASTEPEEREARDVEELLRRPDRKEDRSYECNDNAPLNYNRGPHDEEFGVEESAEDPDLIDYGRGPDSEEECADDGIDYDDDAPEEE